MLSIRTVGLALVLFCVTTLPCFAGPTEFSGKFLAVRDNKVVITVGAQPAREHQFAIEPETKFTRGGVPIAPTALRAGDRVTLVIEIVGVGKDARPRLVRVTAN